MKPLLYPNHPKTLRSFIFESRGCRPDGMPPGTRRVLSSTPAQSSLPCSPGSLARCSFVEIYSPKSTWCGNSKLSPKTPKPKSSEHLRALNSKNSSQDSFGFWSAPTGFPGFARFGRARQAASLQGFARQGPFLPAVLPSHGDPMHPAWPITERRVELLELAAFRFSRGVSRMPQSVKKLSTKLLPN